MVSLMEKNLKSIGISPPHAAVQHDCFGSDSPVEGVLFRQLCLRQRSNLAGNIKRAMCFGAIRKECTPMKATLAVLCLRALPAGINAQTVVGEAGRHKCSEWVGWSVDELPRMTGVWFEGYASVKYGPDYLSANVLSFMSSYREQWPTATLFETIDMAYRYGAKRWDPLGGPQP